MFLFRLVLLRLQSGLRLLELVFEGLLVTRKLWRETGKGEGGAKGGVVLSEGTCTM